jgi:hypothetical protein
MSAGGRECPTRRTRRGPNNRHATDAHTITAYNTLLKHNNAASRSSLFLVPTTTPPHPIQPAILDILPHSIRSGRDNLVDSATRLVSILADAVTQLRSSLHLPTPDNNHHHLAFDYQGGGFPGYVGVEPDGNKLSLRVPVATALGLILLLHAITRFRLRYRARTDLKSNPEDQSLESTSVDPETSKDKPNSTMAVNVSP